MRRNGSGVRRVPVNDAENPPTGCHTLSRRVREAEHQRLEALRIGVELVHELGGSTRRDILEVYWTEVRRPSPMML